MKNTLITLSFLILSGLLAYQSLHVWEMKGKLKVAKSHYSFVEDVSRLNCIKKDTFLKTAKARAWSFIDSSEDGFSHSFAPEGTVSQLHIEFDAQYPLGPAYNPTIFAFDANQCWVPD